MRSVKGERNVLKKKTSELLQVCDDWSQSIRDSAPSSEESLVTLRPLVFDSAFSSARLER